MTLILILTIKFIIIWNQLKKIYHVLNNKLWYIVNSDPTLCSQISTNHFHSINKDYYITKNDIIKLGRVKYIVSEINIINGEEKSEDLNLPIKVIILMKLTQK